MYYLDFIIYNQLFVSLMKKINLNNGRRELSEYDSKFSSFIVLMKNK